MKKLAWRLALPLLLIVALAACDLLIDSTAPEVTIVAPTTVTTSVATIVVKAVDDESGIESIQLFIDGDQRDEARPSEVVRGESSLTFSWDVSQEQSGTYTLTATATNGFGEEAESDPVNITVNTSTAPPEAPEVTINRSAIEPGAFTSNDCPDAQGCFGGNISIPVKVIAPIGTTITSVALRINSERLGTFSQATTSLPAVFTLDTETFGNGDVLTLSAQATTDEGAVGVFDEDLSITILNIAPPPTLSITSPSTGDNLAGVIDVGVAVGDLTGSGYTLDLNGNGSVDGSEGFFIEVFDFAGEVIAETYLNATVSGNQVQATTSGSYTANAVFNTIDYANDTLTLVVSLPARFVESGNIVTLERSVTVDTRNENRVPPSLLILDPTDQDESNIRIIRDPENAFIIVQVTDNLGVNFVETRVYEGQPTDDAQPSRYIHFFDGVVKGTVAMPLSFNANPFLEDELYTVRVVAEDVDGNRTFVDLRVTLERAEEDAAYDLAQIGPLFQDENGDIFVLNPVAKGTVVTLQVLGVEGGETFSHLVRSPTSNVFQPFDQGTGVSNSAYSVGLGVEGGWFFITQVTNADGEVYITGTVGIGVLE